MRKKNWKYLGWVEINGRVAWPTVEVGPKRYIQPEGLSAEDAEENAQLIALLPEMYEALRHLAHNARASGAEMGLALDVAYDLLHKMDGGDK